MRDPEFYKYMRKLAVEAQRMCTVFLSQNYLRVPTFDFDYNPKRHTGIIGSGSGLYTPGTRQRPLLTNRSTPKNGLVQVCIANCAVPVQEPGMRRWSYPAYKVDRTPVGVVAHEVGHHVAWAVAARMGPKQAEYTRAAWAVARRGKQVSGYEPTLDEAGAETLRLFILNPDLLDHAIPERYKFCTDVLGLKPTEHRAYYKVLGDHPTYVEAAKRWIAK